MSMGTTTIKTMVMSTVGTYTCGSKTDVITTNSITISCIR